MDGTEIMRSSCLGELETLDESEVHVAQNPWHRNSDTYVRALIFPDLILALEMVKETTLHFLDVCHHYIYQRSHSRRTVDSLFSQNQPYTPKNTPSDMSISYVKGC